MNELPEEQPNRDFRKRQTPPYDWLNESVPRPLAPRRRYTNSEDSLASDTRQRPSQTNVSGSRVPEHSDNADNRKTHNKKLINFRLPTRNRKSGKKKLLFVPALFALVLVISIIGTTFISSPQKAEAAIGLRDTSATTQATTTSQSITPGAATKEGDVMLVTAVWPISTPGNMSALPTGWVPVDGTAPSGTTCTAGSGNSFTMFRTFWKARASSDTSYTFTWANSVSSRLHLASYSGVNRTTPIHNKPTTANFCKTGASTALSANTISTTLADAWVVGIWTNGNANNGTQMDITPTAAGTNLTERFSINDNYNYSCGLICTNTNRHSFSYSDSNQGATTSNFFRAATSNVTGSWVGTNFALAPATDPTLEQSAYRWLTDNGTANPTAAMAATNTNITNFKIGDTARLRMLLHITTAELQVDLVQFKLRFAPKGASCAASTYSDVSTSSGAIQYSNIAPLDGDNIATTAVDPSHSGHTNIPHTFEEANNFATRQLTPSGQDAMWDFALTNVSAPNNTTYCFKITNSDNSDINTLTVFPELTSINIGYEASAYRWMDKADSTTPGSALAAQDTQATQINTSQDFRLRLLIHNGGTDPIPVGYENLKLQFAVQSGGSCSATPTGSFGDVATASGNIRYRNNATPNDNDTAVTATGDPSHSGHTNTFHTYEEANNFTTRVSQPASQDGLWDFSLTNFSAPFGTVYCFRAVKAADGSTITNTVYPQLTIVNPSFEQAAYRWYDNNNGTTPGTVRAANNTATTGVGQTAQFRLRMLAHISNDPIFSGTETFKLQFATKSGGTCGAYADVATGAGAVRFNDNAAVADGDATSTTANDPSHSAHTIRAQTYEEANNFTSTVNTAVGEDAMWDYSLATSSAPLRTTYCFKIVRSSGSDINTYSVTPELTTIDPKYEQSAYRWLNNADNITPGGALAANNTPVTDISQNTVVRLRMLAHVSNDPHAAGLESFKLQFAPKSGTCDVAFSGESYNDVATGSGEFRYYNNTNVGAADGAAISATGGDPSHGADTIRAQTYEEDNNFTSTSQIAVDEDGMWDFAIQNVSATQNTSWCFRIIKSDGTADFTTSGGSYSQVAELNTAPVALNQSAYRWFQNVNIADMLTITNNPTASALDGINDTALDAAGGYIYLVGHENNQWRIEKRKIADAELCSAAECGAQFGTNGVVTDNLTGTAEQAMAIAIDIANDRMYVVGYDTPSAGNEEWHIQKRKLSDGTLDTGFDTDGRMTPTVTTGNDRIEDIVIDSTYMYLVGWDTGEGQRIRLEKRALSDGVADTGFDPDAGLNSDPQDIRLDGIYAINPSSDSRDDHGTTVAVDSTYLYLVGWDESPGNDNAEWRIEKMNKSTGIHDDGFDTDGVVVYNDGNFTEQAHSIAIDSSYMYVAGSYEPNNNNRGWMIQKRSLTDGTLDTAFDGETGETGNGIIQITLSSGHDDAYDIVIDSTYLYVTGHDSTGTDKGWRTEKRKQSNGKLCTAAECGTAFDTDGIIYTDPSSTLDDEASVIMIDAANSRVYIAGYDQSPASGDTQWRIEKRKSSDGSRGWEPPNALVAQDTKTVLNSGVKFRLRMLVHVSGENMAINAETLKLQIAPKIGTCDAGQVGEVYVDVGTSGGDISYYNNTNISDGDASSVIEGDPTHSGHTNIPETYEEANNFTNPAAINAGQDGLWDFALIDNAAFGNYCFRIVKSDGTQIGAYNVVPEIVFCDRPKTENLLRHGNFFCDDSKKKFYWN